MLLCTTVATAQEFEVDSIYYNITDEANKTVEVIKYKEKKNTGYRKNATKAEQENNVIQKENIS